MKIVDDYHTHTLFSHGINSIEENIKYAIDNGMSTIAITDHGPAYKPYGIDIKEFDKINSQVDFLKEKYKNQVNILLGIEANIINENGDLDISESIINKLDILLVGFHFDIIDVSYLSEVRSLLKRHEGIEKYIDKDLYNHIKDVNTKAMINSIKKHNIDIITHINDKFPVDVLCIGKACAKYNTAIEINNFHRHPNISEIKLLNEIDNLKFSFGSDAHRSKDVGNFKNIQRKIVNINMCYENIINKIIQK